MKIDKKQLRRRYYPELKIKDKRDYEEAYKKNGQELICECGQTIGVGGTVNKCKACRGVV